MVTPETSRGRGSIVRKHGAWRWRRYEHGRERWETLGRCDAMTQRQAEAERDRRIVALNPNSISAGALLTVRQFVERYFEPLHIAVKMKPSSAVSARSLLYKHILPVVGELPLTDLNALAAQQVIASMVRAQLSRHTIENAFAVMSTMSTFARRKGLGAPRLDRELIDFPPTGVEVEQRWFTPDEVARIITASDDPWRACWALCGTLGIRCGEALGLRWLDVDFEQRIVRLRQNAVNRVIGSLKSKNSRADLPMPAELSEVLKAYRAWSDALAWKDSSELLSTSLLFCNEHGQPYTNAEANAALRATLKALGIAHGGLHAFRHGVATQMFRGNATAPTVRAALRHSRLETTMRYTHTVAADARTAFEGVSTAIQHRDSTEIDGGDSPGNR